MRPVPGMKPFQMVSRPVARNILKADRRYFSSYPVLQRNGMPNGDAAYAACSTCQGADAV